MFLEGKIDLDSPDNTLKDNNKAVKQYKKVQSHADLHKNPSRKGIKSARSPIAQYGKGKLLAFTKFANKWGKVYNKAPKKLK